MVQRHVLVWFLRVKKRCQELASTLLHLVFLMVLKSVCMPKPTSLTRISRRVSQLQATTTYRIAPGKKIHAPLPILLVVVAELTWPIPKLPNSFQAQETTVTRAI